MHSQPSHPLDQLRLLDLQVLLEHLRLGPKHLKALLTEAQFNHLLALGPLTKQQKADLTADKLEKCGNIALILNTIITSSFGAWMGLSGCMGFQLGSPYIFAAVVAITLLLSFLVGYHSYQVSKGQVAGLRHQQQITNLELLIMHHIAERQQTKIDHVVQHLYTCLTLKELNATTNQIKTGGEVGEWLEHLEGSLQDKGLQLPDANLRRFFQKEKRRTLKRLHVIFKCYLAFAQQLAAPPVATHRLAALQAENSHLSFLEFLTDPSYAVPKTRPRAPFWLENNWRALAVGLAPTLLGGFASMFVFVGGIPNVAKEFGWTATAAILMHPYARVVELMLAVLITGYLGFSHIYATRKTVQRQNNLDKTEQEVINQETVMIEKSARLKALYKVKYRLQHLLTICQTAGNVEEELV